MPDQNEQNRQPGQQDQQNRDQGQGQGAGGADRISDEEEQNAETSLDKELNDMDKQ
jgi:hypothetical protein